MEIKAIKSYHKLFYIILVWILVGIVISHSDRSLDNNYIHVIVVNIMLFLEIHIINVISKEESKFKTVISGLEISINYNLMANYSKLKTWFSRSYTKAFSLLMGVLYLYIMVSLRILDVNSLIFYYGSITLIITVYYALRLYFKYLFYIYFLKEISSQKLNNKNYNRLFPSRTQWIVNIADFMNKFRFYFSVLGCMYTFEYLFTMDRQFLMFRENSLLISTPNNCMFITSWVVIILFIGLGYFVYSELTKHYLIRIIKKYENLTLCEYETGVIKNTQREEYILLYKLYATNSKVIHTDTNFFEHLVPYIPIVLNLLKIVKELL